MQVSVEELDGLERRITVQVPGGSVDRQVQERLQALARRTRIDGFRPGKAPLKVIKRMYGSRVRHEVVQDLLKESLTDAIAQHGLRPAGGPVIEPKQLAEGQDLEFCATFEVMPEFEIKGLDSLTVERPAAEVTEEDVDRMIENLRQQNTEWSDVDRPARDGDRVVIAYEGTRDGESFEGGSGVDVAIELGAGRALPELEAALAGRAAGESFDLDATLPEDHTNESLRGASVHLRGTIKKVGESKVPDLDEAFAAQLGVNEGGIPAMRAAVRKNMERELRERLRTLIKNRIFQTLLDANDIPPPRVLVEAEMARIAKQAGITPPEGAEGPGLGYPESVQREAARRVALGLLFSRLVADHDIKVENERVRAHVDAASESYEEPEAVTQMFYSNAKLLDRIKAMALEEQVADWLLERATVVDVPASFYELMRGAAASGGGR